MNQDGWSGRDAADGPCKTSCIHGSAEMHVGGRPVLRRLLPPSTPRLLTSEAQGAVLKPARGGCGSSSFLLMYS